MAQGFSKHVGEEESKENDTKSRKLYRPIIFTLIIVVFIITTSTLIAKYATPSMINSYGFTEKGIAKGSKAAKWQSEVAKEYKGVVPKDHLFSELQRAGRKGATVKMEAIVGSSSGAVHVVGFVILCLIGYLCYRCYRSLRNRNREEKIELTEVVIK